MIEDGVVTVLLHSTGVGHLANQARLPGRCSTFASSNLDIKAWI